MHSVGQSCSSPNTTKEILHQKNGRIEELNKECIKQRNSHQTTTPKPRTLHARPAPAPCATPDSHKSPAPQTQYITCLEDATIKLLVHMNAVHLHNNKFGGTTWAAAFVVVGSVLALPCSGYVILCWRLSWLDFWSCVRRRLHDRWRF
jgi:hypothetical protein